MSRLSPTALGIAKKITLYFNLASYYVIPAFAS